MAGIGELEVRTSGRGLYDITAQVSAWLSEQAAGSVLLNVFIRHTSASLIIQENADPNVLVDLDRYLSELVIDGDSRFLHREEGPDDMSAHVRSVLTATSLSVPVRAGRLHLGTWQGLYLWEHRFAAHRRRVELTLIG